MKFVVTSVVFAGTSVSALGLGAARAPARDDKKLETLKIKQAQLETLLEIQQLAKHFSTILQNIF